MLLASKVRPMLGTVTGPVSSRMPATASVSA